MMPTGIIIFIIIIIIRWVKHNFFNSCDDAESHDYEDSDKYTYVYPTLYEEDTAVEGDEYKCEDEAKILNLVDCNNHNEEIAGFKLGEYSIEINKNLVENYMEKEKIANIVKAYFDHEEIKYDENYDLEDDTIVLWVGFSGEREEDSIIIKFVISEDCYALCGWNRYSIPVECHIGCYVALNEYNIGHKVNAFLIKDDGRIVYEYTAITQGGAFSKKSIITAFNMVLNTINEDTSKLFQNAYQYSKKMISEAPVPKKKSWFKR